MSFRVLQNSLLISHVYGEFLCTLFMPTTCSCKSWCFFPASDRACKGCIFLVGLWSRPILEWWNYIQAFSFSEWMEEFCKLTFAQGRKVILVYLPTDSHVAWPLIPTPNFFQGFRWLLVWGTSEAVCFCVCSWDITITAQSYLTPLVPMQPYD